ncbi:MAG: serine hydrolase domain-containing protein [Alteraurantiacibacter sp.]
MPHQVTRRQFGGSAAALAAFVALPQMVRASTATATTSATFEERWPAVSALMQDYVGSGKVANMVAGLGWGTDELQVKSLGNSSFTSGIPADRDTLYRIYSMTKPITGMAVMKCIEDGLLTLDTPLAEVLPKFARMQVQKTYDGPITPDNLEPAVRPITIRHCLTHTAGLGYSIVQQGPLSQAMQDTGVVPGLVTRLQNVPGFRGTAVPSLELFADRLADLPLVYQPGTKWSYSTGLDLLGRVIEVVSGLRFDAYLQQHFFDPLGMSSTFFQVPRDQAHRLVASYYMVGETLVPIDLPQDSVFLDPPPFPFGGSGLVSSARDYDRFLAMLANGGELDGARVLKAETVALGTSDLFPATLAPDGGFSTGGRAFGFGAAGLVGRGDAEGLFGWFGAAGTCGLVNLKYRLRQTLMTQYMPSQAYPLQNDFPLAVAADAARAVS